MGIAGLEFLGEYVLNRRHFFQAQRKPDISSEIIRRSNIRKVMSNHQELHAYDRMLLIMGTVEHYTAKEFILTA